MRPAASSLFWTLGGKQVGKAAISGWQDIVQPCRQAGASIWPFEGDLAVLASRQGLVICETYPAEAYGHVGVKFPRGGTKRSQDDRKQATALLKERCEEYRVHLSEKAQAALSDGFGPREDGEDPFDAMIGLLGMIEVVDGRRAAAPHETVSPTWEGWILGQEADTRPIPQARPSLDAVRPNPQPTRPSPLRVQGSPMTPIRPPFTAETAVHKARFAEDAWNTRDPGKVSLAYTEDSRWRNRAEFLSGQPAIVAFLQRKWARELDYRLIKEVWAFTADRIAVRFAYEWHDDSGQWFRSHGNEQWEFDSDGLMRRREASINDIAIPDGSRLFHWATGPRPAGHPGLSELGL